MDQSAELVSQLKDIELPEASGLGIAPGWFLLGGLILLAIWCLMRMWRRYQYRKLTNWRPEARAALASIKADIEKGQLDNVLPATSQLTRRIALALEPRTEVAELTGEKWLSKLDDLAGNLNFTEGPGRLLVSAPYQARVVEDRSLLQGIVDAVESLIDNNNPTDEKQSWRKNRLSGKRITD